MDMVNYDNEFHKLSNSSTVVVKKDIRAPHRKHVHTERPVVFSYHHQRLLEQVSWPILYKLAFP